MIGSEKQIAYAREILNDIEKYTSRIPGRITEKDAATIIKFGKGVTHINAEERKEKIVGFSYAKKNNLIGKSYKNLTADEYDRMENDVVSGIITTSIYNYINNGIY